MSLLCNPDSGCRIKGCNGILKLSDCGAIDPETGEVDFSLFSDLLGHSAMDLSASATITELEIYGKCSKEREAVDTTFSVNFSAYWCKDDPIQCLLREGCGVQFCWSPTGEDPAGGACAYYGELVIANFQHAAPWGELQQIVIQGQGNGELGRHNWCLPSNVTPLLRRAKPAPIRQPFSAPLRELKKAA